jgi:hypothetical protein
MPMHRHRIVGRPVDPDFLQRIGGERRAGQKCRDREQRREAAPGKFVHSSISSIRLRNNLLIQ